MEVVNFGRCYRLDYLNGGDLVYIFKKGDKSGFISCLEREIMQVRRQFVIPSFRANNNKGGEREMENVGFIY